jgi:hypothetical protein
MIDNLRMTQQLLAALKEALPFEVDLTPRLAEYLKEQRIALADKARHVVTNVSYAGDEGGIMCHIDAQGQGLVVSLTQVRVSRPVRLAIAAAEYHNHRVKKLRKQQLRGG